jgi:hypothetical protein
MGWRLAIYSSKKKKRNSKQKTRKEKKKHVQKGKLFLSLPKTEMDEKGMKTSSQGQLWVVH